MTRFIALHYVVARDADRTYCGRLYRAQTTTLADQVTCMTCERILGRIGAVTRPERIRARIDARRLSLHGDRMPKKTKPRLQARALARSLSLSVIPADRKRFDAWIKKKGIKNRSEAFRLLLDMAGAL